MARIVLDASALLAFLNGEVGADIVAENIVDSTMSVVNLSEVTAKLVEKGIRVAQAIELLSALPINLIPADHALAFRAGTMGAETRELGLSLGDRFCLALAESQNMPVLTADKNWSRVMLDVQIVLIR